MSPCRFEPTGIDTMFAMVETVMTALRDLRGVRPRPASPPRTPALTLARPCMDTLACPLRGMRPGGPPTHHPLLRAAEHVGRVRDVAGLSSRPPGRTLLPMSAPAQC